MVVVQPFHIRVYAGKIADGHNGADLFVRPSGIDAQFRQRMFM